MKRVLVIILTAVIIVSLFSGCSITRFDKNRDSSGYIQYIAEFHKRLFGETHNENSEQKYYPENPNLESSFVYGPHDVKFTAQYEADKIIYTVDKTEDYPITAKVFSDIFAEYYDSWKNYIEKTDVGGLSVVGNSRIEMTISGYQYSVTFEPPNLEKATITYEVITIY
ncbi:MAG: hypothetical protein E7517_00420 [Ruminococcaceae bacterium]|nr:hypothetical protein [Oscillospiraceae bacterium]